MGKMQYLLRSRPFLISGTRAIKISVTATHALKNYLYRKLAYNENGIFMEHCHIFKLYVNSLLTFAASGTSESL